MTEPTRAGGGGSTALNRMEVVLSQLLRMGVVISAALIFVGILVSLVRHPDYLSDPGTLARLTDPGGAFPHTMADLGWELGQFRGRAIVTVGLLVLIATPVLRVAVSIAAFAVAREWRFVVITAAVLLVLLVSFLIGKVD
jgi:uncharacterized membrane protein